MLYSRAFVVSDSISKEELFSKHQTITFINSNLIVVKMKQSAVTGYHSSVSNNLIIELLDVTKLSGFPYGGHGLYISSKKEYARGPRLHYVEANGLTLNLLNSEDVRYYLKRQDAFLIRNRLTGLQDEGLIKFYDEFATKDKIQIIIMNSETTVIKDLECITKLSLIK
jgi:hypothetical protein